MQKGDGIPAARKRNSYRLIPWQGGPHQPRQPRLYWHPNPCIATPDCVAAMLDG